MRFQITEAEAREMAKLEEECGCDISAGPDWGIYSKQTKILLFSSSLSRKSPRKRLELDKNPKVLENTIDR